MKLSHENRSPDGDGRGMTGRTSTVDSDHSVELPIPSDPAKSSGDTTAVKAARNSPKAGAGSNPADSHTLNSRSEGLMDPHGFPVTDINGCAAVFERGKTDAARRFGMLGYGVMIPCERPSATSATQEPKP